MKLENSDSPFNLVLQISKSNRSIIELLLNHGCLTYTQLCSDILKVIHECFKTPVNSRTFHVAFNSFINCYLQFVLCENKKFRSVPKQHVNIFNIKNLFEAMSREFSVKTCKNVENLALANVAEPNLMNYVDRLRKFINHNSLDIDFDHLRINKHSKLIDVCVDVKDTNSEDIVIMQSLKNKQIFAVDDFQTFLSPLKEDYTKSSKGYICQKIAGKNEISCVEFLSEDDLCNLTDHSDTDESSFVDDNFDPVYDNIISRYFDSFKNLSSDSDLSLNGRVSNSDSDNSIAFSDNLGECVHYQVGYGAKHVKPLDSQHCNVLSSESDSEDSEIFNSVGNKFFHVKCSNINVLSELNDFDLIESSDSDSFEFCDNNSSPNHQSFEKSLNKNSSCASISLSQGNIQIYSTYFDGFVNPCFEDDAEILENEFLRNVNDEWDHSMQDVSCEPREPKKVSFLPMPNLVTVKTFEPDNDGYRYGLHLLNQVRFKNRIDEFEQIIKPYLSANHRANMYNKYFCLKQPSI